MGNRPAHADDVLVDLIFDPQGGAIDDGIFERAGELEVHAMRMNVAALEDVLLQKLLALKEQEPDHSSVLELAPALREQVDWADVREGHESRRSPRPISPCWTSSRSSGRSNY